MAPPPLFYGCVMMRINRSFAPFKRRQGFTLVEVALAVAVGLIIIGGAVVGYGAVKDNASSANARKRVAVASGKIAEYASVNHGRYPTSVADAADGTSAGSFSAMWVRAMPDEYMVSPWGGPLNDVNGVIELAPLTTGAAEASGAPDVSGTITQDGTRAGTMIYASIPNNRWVRVQAGYNPTADTMRGYLISIYDRTGTPWFHVSGGNKL